MLRHLRASTRSKLSRHRGGAPVERAGRVGDVRPSNSAVSGGTAPSWRWTECCVTKAGEVGQSHPLDFIIT